MLNNRNIVFNLPRMPNVRLQITTSNGEKENFYHKQVEAVVMAFEGVTYMEVRRFGQPSDAEPLAISTYVNPAKWELIAHPDEPVQ